MKIEFGASRMCFLIGKWAIKIPAFNYGWRNFLNGLLHNMNERNMWEFTCMENSCVNKEILCPVKFCMWGGWFLIMPRCKPLKYNCNDFFGALLELGIKDVGIDNCGFLADKLVCFDYAS